MSQLDQACPGVNNQEAVDDHVANLLMECTAVGATSGGVVGHSLLGITVGAGAGLSLAIVTELFSTKPDNLTKDNQLSSKLLADTVAGEVAGYAVGRNFGSTAIGAAAGLGFGLVDHVIIPAIFRDLES